MLAAGTKLGPYVIVAPGQDRRPVWTPDGRRLVFGSDRAKPGVGNLYRMNAAGTGEVKRLTESPESEFPYSWHPSACARSRLRASDEGSGV